MKKKIMMLTGIVTLLPLLLAPVNGCQTPAIVPVLAAPLEVSGIKLLADKATLTGSTLQQKTLGFSGTGYAADFAEAGAKIEWTIPNAKAGLYTVQVRYSSPTGQKGYDLVVNGKKSSNMFPPTKDGFATVSGGKVELADGANTLAIERGWGYYAIDSVELAPAPPAPVPRPVPAKLSDPKATPATQALFDLLRANYGKRTFSGQASFGDTKYVQDTVKKTPLVQAGDFIEYSPTRIANGSDPKNEVEEQIAAAKRGQIVTMLWHWNAPMGIIGKEYTNKDGKTINGIWWRGFYTDASTFDLAKAMNDTKSPEYAAIISDIDVIAAQMKKFDAAGVPVLFRPLHEAEGGWFWWGAKGPEPFKKLWKLMYERITVKHKLHNLIWVYSSGTDPKWYPGDKVVDVVGIDQYPSDPGDALSNVWDTLLSQYDGRKMLALTEFGGVPDIVKMERYGVRWSYFASWQGSDLGPKRYPTEELTRLYNAPSVITQENLATAKVPASKK